jgi:hypothetical protein
VYQTISSLAVNSVANGSNAIIAVGSNPQAVAGNVVLSFQTTVDGTPIAAADIVEVNSLFNAVYARTYWVTGLTVGAHSINLQAKINGANSAVTNNTGPDTVVALVATV